VLARTMGLHQVHASSGGVCPEEAQERLKVFGSLYLRDKSLSISRGSICWLPSFDCSLSAEIEQSGFANSNSAAQIQLARLQEETYRLLHSGELHGSSSAKRKKALSRVLRSLDHWANTNDIFSLVSKNGRDVSLQLEFLAARTSAFYGSPEPSHIRQALDDSRASCLLLLVSYGKYDQPMVERLESLLPSKSQKKRPSDPESNERYRDPSLSNAREGTSESLPPWFHSLLNMFPVPAFFLLAKSIMWPVSASDQSQTEEDMDLLQEVCACYKDINGKTQANSHANKVGRTFERLLGVINLIKNSQAPEISPQTTHRSGEIHNSLSTQNLFGGPQDIPCLSDLSSASTYPMSHMFWRDPPTKNTSATAKGGEAMVGPSGLRTPMESPYMEQATEPPQQSFSPHFQRQQQQQQTMSPPDRKRPRVSEPDFSVDNYADSRLLFDFLAANPMMSSDFMPQDDLTSSIF
jgi:hypothetical protein